MAEAAELAKEYLANSVFCCHVCRVCRLCRVCQVFLADTGDFGTEWTKLCTPRGDLVAAGVGIELSKSGKYSSVHYQIGWPISTGELEFNRQGRRERQGRKGGEGGREEAQEDAKKGEKNIGGGRGFRGWRG